MKFDKEALVKNRFWLMLGGVVLLVLIAFLWLTTDVAADNFEKKDKQEKHRQQAEATRNGPLPGKDEERVLEEKRKALEAQKNVVWTQAWDLQNNDKDPFIVWPERVEKESKLGTKKFGFAFDSGQVPNYTRAESYGKQVRDLGDFFKVSIDGGPVFDPVQFKDGWQKVIRHVRNDRGEVGWKSKAEVEEVWLAQEDFWVQRALLRAVKAANDSVARFVPVEGAGKLEKDELYRRRFENPYWQIDLAVAKKGGDVHLQGTLANVGKRRQTLGKDGRIFFLVRLNRDENSPPVPLEIQADALGVGGKTEFSTKKPIKGVKEPEGLFGVEQVLETTTSPVKRIDRIVLYAQSHRTFQPTLYKPSFSPGPDSFAGTAGLAQAIKPGEAPPKASATEVTENGLVRYRYSDRTGEVRRMPLGIVLIVDQAHVPEVQTALINSNLRFQETQVHVQHHHEKLVESKEGVKGEEAVGGNLVELSIYGIASLFERPPEKK